VIRRFIRIPLLAGLIFSVIGLPTSAQADTFFTLSVTRSGNGRGTVTSSPAGIDCGDTCSFDFSASTPVTLTAVARSSATFTGWSGGGCSGTGVCLVTMDSANQVDASFTRLYRPDAWIKWCGSGDTCVHAPPHKYRGEDVFNTSGAHQTYPAGVEEGNDIRFWILFENDGQLSDTFFVKGCSGNSSFFIRAVNIGRLKMSHNAPIITKKFKKGTAKFSFPPGDTKHNVVITLDIWVKTAVFGARYTCPITVSSANSPKLRDRVVAKMVTV
jgi:hypothetical protein